VLHGDIDVAFQNEFLQLFYCFSASFHSLLLRFGRWAANPAERVSPAVLSPSYWLVLLSERPTSFKAAAISPKMLRIAWLWLRVAA
jgi:hypothetical protein